MKWYQPYILAVPVVACLLLTWPQAKPVTKPVSLPVVEVKADPIHCMVTAVYYEARGGVITEVGAGKSNSPEAGVALSDRQKKLTSNSVG